MSVERILLKKGPLDGKFAVPEAESFAKALRDLERNELGYCLLETEAIHGVLVGGEPTYLEYRIIYRLTEGWKQAEFLGIEYPSDRLDGETVKIIELTDYS